MEKEPVLVLAKLDSGFWHHLDAKIRFLFYKNLDSFRFLKNYEIKLLKTMD